MDHCDKSTFTKEVRTEANSTVRVDWLCSICAGIVEQGPRESYRWEVTETQHHSTYESFRQAVRDGCHICCVCWEEAVDNPKLRWVKSTFLMTFTFLKNEMSEDDSPGWVNLRISILCDQNLKNNPGAPQVHVHLLMFPAEDRTRSSVDKSANTSSTDVLDQALDWHNSCRLSHATCSFFANRGSFMPTRLLDIGVGNDANWRLCLPAEEGPEHAPYMSLSYRWGPSPQCLLRKTSLDQYRHGALIKDLPLTFQEAIIVARHFRIRYLWIDALCIIQDSIADWDSESAKMKDVYSHSFMNIAAAASTSPEGGLFRSREPKRLVPGHVITDASLYGTELCTIANNSRTYWSSLHEGPFYRRGWIFQERLLAPRVISFGEEQCFWECFCEAKCEAVPYAEASGVNRAAGKEFVRLVLEAITERRDARGLPPGIQYWKALIWHYTRTTFTKAGDRLVGISGLADLFQEVLQDEYLAGLWRSDLISQLGWCTRHPIAQGLSGRRSPSWAWTSIDTPIDLDNHSERVDFIVIRDAHVQRSGMDASGHALHGEIVLQGHLFTVTIRENADTGLTRGFTVTVEDEEFPLRFAYFLPDVLEYCIDISRRTTCLLLYGNQHSIMTENGLGSIDFVCLVLDSDGCEPMSYKRWGHLTLYGFGLHGHSDELLRVLGLQKSASGTIELSEEVELSIVTLI